MQAILNRHHLSEVSENLDDLKTKARHGFSLRGLKASISGKIDVVLNDLDARLKKSRPYRRLVYTTTAIVATLLMFCGMVMGMRQVTWLGIAIFFVLFAMNFYLHAFYFYLVAVSEGKPQQQRIASILKWSYILGAPLTLFYGLGVLVLLVGRVWAGGIFQTNRVATNSPAATTANEWLYAIVCTCRFRFKVF